ncbi:MAG TPA: hypothetical protein PLH92_08625 [Mycobacterium sp.]|nr:hypothetical protein [Mycobacterium sp.]HQC76772.1 hypothetical protein [Mycobacterium sp.]
MIAVQRPFAAAGIALLGAGVIAATPVLPRIDVAMPHLQAPAIALQSSIFDILQFPAFQQAVANEIEFVAIQASGLAQSGTGLLQSVVALPPTLITATQQLFSNNPLDALDTVETWAIDSATAIVEPWLVANINVGQIQLAIQSALLPAEPLALVSVGNGFLNAFDAVSRASIIAVQNVVAALGTLNIGNIVTAVVSGISGVAQSFVTGGQALVDGIVGAQTLIADALKARPVAALSASAATVGAASAKQAAPRAAAAKRKAAPAATAKSVAHQAKSAAASRRSAAAN